MSGSWPLGKLRPMQSLCCHAEQESQQIMSRSTSSSSSYSPQMHRMISSSSSSPSSLGPGVGSAEALLDLSLFAFPLPFFGASGSSRFLCWPFVARPERRGSSAIVVSKLWSLARVALARVCNDVVSWRSRLSQRQRLGEGTMYCNCLPAISIGGLVPLGTTAQSGIKRRTSLRLRDRYDKS